MKNKIIKQIIILVIIGIVAVILISYFQRDDSSEKIPQPTITLYLHESRQVVQMEIEKYVSGVVAAEMPASFDMEALKSQALCARTYACKKIMENRPYPMEANLSDDITCCQAYVSWEQFQDLHPAQYELLKAKIEEAVLSTRGEIIIYKGKPIDALYHSTCGGQTESAAEVWGSEIAYLQSVDCNYCSISNYYESSQVISYQDLNSVSSTLMGSQHHIEISEKSPSGRAREIKLNDQEISASKFRQLFNLPSTHWEFKTDQDNLIINSRGYGHGVGLCQYGANGMALDGKDYKGIISHYYKNTRIYKLNYQDN